jgi:tetraacyldisaccharide-1-P 4'-kinase
MLCAIATPDGFGKSLAEAGVNLSKQVRRPDHDPLTAGNLFDGLDRNTALVVTAKDWVKLSARSDLDGRKILIALQNAEIEPAAEFQTWLRERLAQVRAS